MLEGNNMLYYTCPNIIYPLHYKSHPVVSAILTAQTSHLILDSSTYWQLAITSKQYCLPLTFFSGVTLMVNIPLNLYIMTKVSK